jgi:TATA-binding protein-associated factor
LQGNLLLASSGKEFIKPAGILSSSAEVKKARKEAMGRLGLEFLDNVADEMDLEKELADEAETGDIEMEEPAPEHKVEVSSMETCPPVPPIKEEDTHRITRSVTPTVPSPTTSNAPSVPDVDLGAMSARERNRLKRKRKPGNSAFVAAPPPQSSGAKYSAAPSGPSNKSVIFFCSRGINSLVIFRARLISADDKMPSESRISSPALTVNGTSSEKVVIDPSKGGAISPKAAQQSKALDVKHGLWVWDGVVKVLEVDLFSAAWEVRHGAAMALRELLKVQGKFGGMRGTSPTLLDT